MNALDQLASIHRTSLHEELVERLQAMIVEGVLQPGKKVPERELCEKLGVSRTPMREALKVLAADGLLTLEPNRGARVRPITTTELEEAFQLMGALETLAGELACKHINDIQLADLKHAHQEMLACFEKQDIQSYFTHNQRIHEIIMEAANNEMLKSIYKSLAVRVRRTRYMANMNAERWQNAVNEHEQILTAIEARDGKALGEILKLHMANKFRSIRQWLATQPDTQ
ncbi:MAG: GntR family transcriptional regulator [Granulosicoccus sp.]|nr:GntR family transcriptional regulator [Granulosicoccus sp.]